MQRARGLAAKAAARSWLLRSCRRNGLDEEDGAGWSGVKLRIVALGDARNGDDALLQAIEIDVNWRHARCTIGAGAVSRRGARAERRAVGRAALRAGGPHRTPVR